MSTINKKYKRIVIKLGTNLLTGGTDNLDKAAMERLVAQVSDLHKMGIGVVLVSSGAIAAGRSKLKLSGKLSGTPLRQVLASIGQSRLMNIYERLFKQNSILTAQALLTKTDLSDRLGYLNARNTLLSLLSLGIVCIVNENDVVAVDELGEAKFGDNDNLSAMVANLVDADLLLMLTDIGGLYDADPSKNPDAKLITEIKCIDKKVEKLAGGTSSKNGTGGMTTKIEAAKIATSSGTPVVIADGRKENVILKVLKGEEPCTLFLPGGNRLESRKRWMVSGLCKKGSISIDEGAVDALKNKNCSLLPKGITGVKGKFRRGALISLLDASGTPFGCGITNYSASDIEKIKGTHSKDIVELLGYDYGTEIVHRNNLVIT